MADDKTTRPGAFSRERVTLVAAALQGILAADTQQQIPHERVAEWSVLLADEVIARMEVPRG